VTKQLRDDRTDPVMIEDSHLADLNPRWRLQLGHVARHHGVPNGIVESVREQAVRVNDGPGRNTTVAAAAATSLQRCVPLLDVDC
jgi:hypothetical protein